MAGYKTYSSGLTIKQPNRGTRSYFSTLDTDTFAKISAHDHSGSGNGAAVNSANLSGSISTWTPTITGSGTLVLSSPTIRQAIYSKNDPWVLFSVHVAVTVDSGTGSEILITHPLAGVAHAASTYFLGILINSANSNNLMTWSYDGTYIRGSGLGAPNLAAGSVTVTIDGKYRRV